MKKLSAIFLIFALMLTVGCGKKKETTSSQSDTSSGIINATDEENTTSSENQDSIGNNSSDMNNSLSSSDKSNTSSKDDTVTDTENTNSDNLSSENHTSSDSNITKPPYEDIVCRSIADNGWKNVEFVSNTDNSYISLNIPEAWDIQDGKILLDGKEIGTVKTTPGDKSIQSYETNSLNVGTTVFKSSIEEYTSNDKKVFKRLFKVSDFTETVGKNLFYISVDYSALDTSATAKMLSSIEYLGTERKIPQIENESMVFLILGNSISESSKISEFLSDMLITEGSKYTLETRIKTSVTDFASDSQLIKEIENGTFAYVFQCGFYTETEKAINNSQGIKILLDAAQKSKTGFVIFPTYNDHTVEINNILATYPTLYCLNWKEEINSLIDSGVSATKLTESDFCTNDNPNQSTPLAGYVGAHIIYRNLFGKMPPDVSESAPLKMTEIKEKLLTYTSTGIIPGKSEIQKFYI